jgi:transcriptional regulator with XRE-family HTH domain
MNAMRRARRPAPDDTSAAADDTAESGSEYDYSKAAIASRLQATRVALGLNQTDLCRRAGIELTTYNQWERGHIRPGLDEAFKLCDCEELAYTLDWIYRGEPSSQLPFWLAVQLVLPLAEIEARHREPPRGRLWEPPPGARRFKRRR